MSAEISISRIACDFIVLTAIAVPLLIFHEFVTPYKRGFYCDDESIRYPYRKSTISRQMLIVVGILIPTMLILATEVLRALAWERRCVTEFSSFRYRKYNVHRLIVRLYIFIGYFFVGVCFNQLMVDIAKYTIGRHRPHFMEVCQPNPGYNNCAMDHKYIVDFQCNGTNQYLIHEAQLSFYSGHSAFSFYAAWYTTFYLQARLFRPLYSRLVLPVLQFSLFAGATFVAYTRVSDYKHHWSDVLVGAVFGSVIGIINALFIAEVFERREVPQKFRRKARTLGYRQSLDGEENGRLKDYELECGNKRDLESGPHSNQRSVPPTRIVVEEQRLPSIMRPTVHEIQINRGSGTSFPSSRQGNR